MIVGIGTDIVEISRIRAAIEKNPRFLEKVFTQAEIAYATTQGAVRYESLAGMWAAKEAFAKATKKGFRDFGFRDVEVLHDTMSAPYLQLYRKATLSAGDVVHISISHSDQTAVAYCIIERS